MLKNVTFAAGIIALAAAQQASAASIYLTDVSPRTSMTVTFPGLSAQTTPYVGQINWSFDRSNPANAGLDAIIPGSTISTFCIEGTQDVFINQTANFANIYSDISLAPRDNVGSTYQMGPGKASLINQFWDAYYGQATLSNVNAAAFQLGIWEMLYDAAPNFGTGLFQATPTGDGESISAFNQSQLWLSNFQSIIPETHYQLYAFSDSGLQDQLFGVPTGGPGGSVPTPLPAALPAGLGLMGAIGIYKKLRGAR